MEHTTQVTWETADTINGVGLRALFKIQSDASQLQSIHVAFTYSYADDDTVDGWIPTGGEKTHISHRFRKRWYELEAELYLTPFPEPGTEGPYGIWGNLFFGPVNSPDKIHFGGIMVLVDEGSRLSDPPFCPPVNPIHPPVKKKPIDLSPHQIGDIFPYVFLRNWSRWCAPYSRCLFVSYLPGSPPGDTLYMALATASPRTWQHLQDIVDAYIQGQLPTDFPFVACPDKIPGLLQKFARVYIYLKELPLRCEEEKTVQVIILELLDISHEELTSYLKTPAYQTAKERVWQTYFALLIKLGCRVVELERFTATLLAAALIEEVFLNQLEGLTAEEVRRWIEASIELPAAVFPLPPPQTSPPLSRTGTAAPFALGDLQRLEYSLVRYQPGDLARIENVMSRERKERSRRRLERNDQTHTTASTTTSDIVSATQSESANLFQQVLQSVASDTLQVKYDNFSVSYGAPTTATLQGGWEANVSPGSTPATTEASRLARQLVDQTVRRISQRVDEMRVARTLQESEDTERSIIDNTGSNESLVSVFRWLSQVFRAQVYHYGLRLMVKFVLPRPAEKFILQEEQRSGTSLRRPVPPGHYSIDSFEAINADNYAALYAKYEVSDDLLPPSSPRLVATVLQQDEVKEVLLPDGYRATKAYVSLAALDKVSSPIQGLVGRQSFSLSSGQAQQTLPMSHEEQTVPVALLGSILVGSPPALLSLEFAITVEIECQTTPHTYAEWQIRAYNAIIAGYQRQLATYRHETSQANSGHHRATINPHVLAMRERQELRRQSIAVLESMNYEPYAFTPEGVASPPHNELEDFHFIDRGFFEHLLEWKEMSYWYSPSPTSWTGTAPRLAVDNFADGLAEDIQAGSSFSEFLQAASATVLVPVRPEHVLAALYFFRSGMIWTGQDTLVPVNPGDQGLVCELKTAARLPSRLEPIGQIWEVVVPTSEQILAGREDCLIEISDTHCPPPDTAENH